MENAEQVIKLAKRSQSVMKQGKAPTTVSHMHVEKEHRYMSTTGSSRICAHTLRYQTKGAERRKASLYIDLRGMIK